MELEFLNTEIKKLQTIVKNLENKFDRKFTLDGHLVGSIGEVYAKLRYGIELYKPSYKCHDGYLECSTKVQIKMTQGSYIILSSKPQHLLILKLTKEGAIDELYYDDGTLIWENATPNLKNDNRRISLTLINKIKISKK